MSPVDDTWDLLADVVQEISYKNGFRLSFNAADRDSGCLRIYAYTADSIRIGEDRNTRHEFLVPHATYDELNWVRWCYERIKLVELHEAAEFFTYRGRRVMAPHHGNGNDPYFEWFTIPDRTERVQKSPGDD